MRFLDKITIYYVIIIFLISLYLLESLTFGLDKILFQLAPPLLATVVTDISLNYFKRKIWIKPITAVISGLIIGLVGQLGEQTVTLILIAISAMLIKNFIKLGGRPIFNPAASGLFLGMIFFSSNPAWWGGGSVPWIFLIWIPILLYKLRRWAPMAGFLVPLVILQGLNILTSPSLLFFISVMLIEPKTSPFMPKIGLIYGLIVALGYLVLGNLTAFDPLIPSLLFGNLTARVIAKYT